MPPQQWELFTRTLPFVFPIKLGVFLLSKMYRGMWRYTSLRDLYNLTKGVVISSLLLTAWLAIFYRLEGYPRSILVLPDSERSCRRSAPKRAPTCR